MVDSLGYDKNYWIVFAAEYPFISKKYANYQSSLKSSFDAPFYETSLRASHANHIILPPLKHSHIFAQCLNVYLVDFSECCVVFLGSK